MERTILQGMSDDRAKAACSVEITSAGYPTNVFGADTEKGELPVFLRKLSFKFFGTGPYHLHLALHCHVSIPRSALQ